MYLIFMWEKGNVNENIAFAFSYAIYISILKLFFKINT